MDAIAPATSQATLPVENASVEADAMAAAAAYQDPTSQGATLPLLTVELPSLAPATLIPGESRALAPLDAAREAVTVEAISAIEADIASLLAAMSEFSDAPPADPAPSGDQENDGDSEEEDATLALLSELERLWQADPMVGATHQS